MPTSNKDLMMTTREKIEYLFSDDCNNDDGYCIIDLCYYAFQKAQMKNEDGLDNTWFDDVRQNIIDQIDQMKHRLLSTLDDDNEPTIPTGMVEWRPKIDDINVSPPDDWGAPYLMRNGNMFDPGHNKAGANWTGSGGDIIAYTPVRKPKCIQLSQSAAAIYPHELVAFVSAGDGRSKVADDNDALNKGYQAAIDALNRWASAFYDDNARKSLEATARDLEANRLAILEVAASELHLVKGIHQ